MDHRSNKRAQSLGASKSVKFSRGAGSLKTYAKQYGSSVYAGARARPAKRAKYAGFGAGRSDEAMHRVRGGAYSSMLNRNKVFGRPVTDYHIKQLAKAAVMDNNEQKFLSLNYNNHILGHNQWSKGPTMFNHDAPRISSAADAITQGFNAHTNMFRQIRIGGGKGQRVGDKIHVTSVNMKFKIRTSRAHPATKYRIVVYTTPFGSKHAETDAVKDPSPPQIVENADASVDSRDHTGAVVVAPILVGIDRMHCLIDQSADGVKVLSDEEVVDKTPPQHKTMGDGKVVPAQLFPAVAEHVDADGDTIAATAAYTVAAHVPFPLITVVENSEFTYNLNIGLDQMLDYIGPDLIYGSNKSVQTNLHVAIIAYDPNHHVDQQVLAINRDEAYSQSNDPLAQIDCRYCIYYKEPYGR